MAAKRNKTQAKRNNGSGGQSLPGWAWLVLGLVLGIGVFLVAPKFLGGGEGFFRPQPNPDAQPPAVDASDREAIVGDNDSDTADIGNDANDGGAAKEQDYAFYNLLSGEETPITDAELAAKTRAEEKRDAQTQAANAADSAPTPDPKTPDAVDNAERNDSANATTKPPVAIDTPDTTPSPDDAPTRTTTATATAAADTSRNDDARYLLQAGAFGASGDAEALKAKIAFLGLSARVESAQIKGSTVYRVRMGPYGTATDLADAKRKLAGGGLPAMAIKVK